MIDYIILGVLACLSGCIGGFLAKNVETLLKDATLRIRMDAVESNFSTFEDRFNVKYNKIARTVKDALGDITDIEQELPQDMEIPPELQGLANSLGIDIPKLLTGDPENVEKLQNVLNKDSKKGGMITERLEGGI